MTSNHRVLKRGLELLITEKSPVDRSEIRRIVEQETVKITAERVNGAIAYSEGGERKRANIDFDLTHLNPSEKSAGKIWAKYAQIIKKGE